MKEYFFDAIKEVWHRIFEGRVRRKQFWMYFLWYWIISALTVGGGFFFTFNGVRVVGMILVWVGYIIAGLAGIPNLSLQVRRLHDIGKSGWNLLLIPVPYFVLALAAAFTQTLWLGVVGILASFVLMLYFFCKDSQPGENQYGPNPKGIN